MTRDAEGLRALAEASAWRVRLTELEVDTTPAFEAWRATPAHAEAWDQVCRPHAWWGEQAVQPEVMALRAAALDRARQAQAARGRPGARRRRALALLVASLLVAVVGVGAWWSTAPQVYRTALGERRTVTLKDGSKLALDAGTEVRVRLAPRARRLALIRGQARFDVAHDTARPFTVRAAGAVVVATGTSFNVDLLGRAVTVTLIEGRVSVLRDDARGMLPLAVAPTRPGAPLLARLVPGQQLTVAAAPAPASVDPVSPPIRLAVVDADKAVAWETGQLVFDDEPLAAVAARVGRYAPAKVVVESSAADLTLSGVFNAGDLSTFLDVVQRALPVTAAQDADGTIRLSHR
ncbi:FecR family protein [Phenylobacterium sp. VNQ135]|uniref:FecR family protein n=1 Tax=Phenylobacterium sp. VNQ135 TaxID=3400922 RepID=UPI003BFD20C9